jgi:hypothetical protein
MYVPVTVGLERYWWIYLRFERGSHDAKASVTQSKGPDFFARSIGSQGQIQGRKLWERTRSAAFATAEVDHEVPSALQSC